jgi:cytoskeleton protein RodZ
MCRSTTSWADLLTVSSGSDLAPCACVEVGQRLSEARRRRNLTLVDIARSTKIPVHYLEAIERDDVDHMPRGFFARAFVRTYATEVGLNPSELLDSVDQPEVAEPDPNMPSPAEAIDEPASVRWPLFVIPVVAVCGLYYLGFTRTGTTSEAPQVAAEIPMAPADPIEPAAAAFPRAAADVELQIRSTGGCIVTVTADGRPISSEATPPGSALVLKARGEVVLRVGDSSACAPVVKPSGTAKIERRPRIDATRPSSVAVAHVADQPSVTAAPVVEPTPAASDELVSEPDLAAPPEAGAQF